MSAARLSFPTTPELLLTPSVPLNSACPDPVEAPSLPGVYPDLVGALFPALSSDFQLLTFNFQPSNRLPLPATSPSSTSASANSVPSVPSALIPALPFDLQLLTFDFQPSNLQTFKRLRASSFPFISFADLHPLSPLAATLMHLPASVAYKRLTAQLNSLDATFKKTRGRGFLRPYLITSLLPYLIISLLPYFTIVAVPPDHSSTVPGALASLRA